MQKVFVIMGLLSMLGFTAVAQKAQAPATGSVCTLKVEGMRCGACAAQVEKVARKVDGVTAAKVNQPKGIAEITYDGAKTSPAAIARASSEKTDFAVEVVPPDKR